MFKTLSWKRFKLWNRWRAQYRYKNRKYKLGVLMGTRISPSFEQLVHNEELIRRTREGK